MDQTRLARAGGDAVAENQRLAALADAVAAEESEAERRLAAAEEARDDAHAAAVAAVRTVGAEAPASERPTRTLTTDGPPAGGTAVTAAIPSPLAERVTALMAAEAAVADRHRRLQAARRATIQARAAVVEDARRRADRLEALSERSRRGRSARPDPAITQALTTLRRTVASGDERPDVPEPPRAEAWPAPAGWGLVTAPEDQQARVAARLSALRAEL